MPTRDAFTCQGETLITPHVPPSPARHPLAASFHLLLHEEHVLPNPGVVLHELQLHRVLLRIPPLRVCVRVRVCVVSFFFVSQYT